MPGNPTNTGQVAAKHRTKNLLWPPISFILGHMAFQLGNVGLKESLNVSNFCDHTIQPRTLE